MASKISKNPARKKESFDNDALLERREKMLDKINDLLYNIRTRVGKDKGMQEVLPTDFTKNGSRTAINTGILKSISEALTKASKETGLTPVIAGGFVRDTLLGCSFRDIDVFLLGAEDLDDDNVYFTEIFREAYPAYERAFQAKGTNYGDGKFVTYSSGWTGQYVMDVMTTTDKTPEELIDGFDYGLVKCYYDVASGRFFVHSDFIDSVKANRIPYVDDKTRRRAQDFRDRTGYKIVVGNPPRKPRKEPIEDTPSIIDVKTFNDAYFRQAAAMEQRLIDARAFFAANNQQVWGVDRDGNNIRAI